MRENVPWDHAPPWEKLLIAFAWMYVLVSAFQPPPPTRTSCCSLHEKPVVGHFRRAWTKRLPRTTRRKRLHVAANARWVSRGARIKTETSKSSSRLPNGECSKDVINDCPANFFFVNGVNNCCLMAFWPRKIRAIDMSRSTCRGWVDPVPAIGV